MKVQVYDVWNQEKKDWDDWSSYEPHAVWISVTVVQANGELHEDGVKQLADAIGWDDRGIQRFAPDATKPEWDVCVSVKQETYDNRQQFRGSWLSRGDAVPGDGGVARAVAPERLTALNAALSGKIRAVVGAAAFVPPASRVVNKGDVPY